MTGVSTSSAAPAGAASGAPASPATANAPAAAPAAPKTDAPTWGEKDDSELFERLQRSPYAKYTADGKEQHVKSKADFEALTRAAQRVSGVNKALEEAKNHRLAAAKELETAKREREMIARARKGDPEAWRELNLVAPGEQEALERQLLEMPEEQRELYLQNMELQEQVQATKREEARREAQAQRQKLVVQVKQTAAEVSQALGLANDPDLVHSVAAAMDDLSKAGLELGVNVTPEDVRDYAIERAEADAYARVKKLPHARAMAGLGDYLQAAGPEGVKALAPALAKMAPAQVMEALGDKGMPFARAVSAWLVQQIRGKSAAPSELGGAPEQTQRAEAKERAERPAPMARTFGLAPQPRGGGR